jgi:hypothetical protein
VRSFEIDQVFRARQNIALTIDFAKRNGLTFAFTRLPSSFPYEGGLKMDRQTMQALFDQGLALSTTRKAWLNSTDLILELGQREAVVMRTPSLTTPN